MTKTLPLLAALSALLLAGCATPPETPAPRNDFPTVDRVLFVQDCMRNNPGAYYEMVNKCSCALDRIAEQVKHEDWVAMQTITNAMTIGGERGNDLRDNDTLKPQLRRYRELNAAAAKSCFIGPR